MVAGVLITIAGMVLATPSDPRFVEFEENELKIVRTVLVFIGVPCVVFGLLLVIGASCVSFC